jgi:hypothetical protein
MIGKYIRYKQKKMDFVLEEFTEIEVEKTGEVVDAYTKISTHGMPNGSTGTSTERTYVVRPFEEDEFVEVSLKDITHIAPTPDK